MSLSLSKEEVPESVDERFGNWSPRQGRAGLPGLAPIREVSWPAMGGGL